MPGLNRKGPEGQGPRTGRGMGRCNPDFKEDNNSQDEMGRGLGRGMGRGRRGRRGQGFGPGRGAGRGQGRGQGR